MPSLDRNFRNKQHQCTTQTQMFHDSKVLECLIRILCEKKEYSNLLFWRYCGTRDLGCATWNTFVPIAWIRRIGVLELKLYVVKVYLSDPSGNDLSDFPSPNIFLLFLLRFSSPPQKNNCSFSKYCIPFPSPPKKSIFFLLLWKKSIFPSLPKKIFLLQIFFLSPLCSSFPSQKNDIFFSLFVFLPRNFGLHP